jgi:hypothetical protein
MALLVTFVTNLRMLADDIERIIRQHPGLTATQIAAKLYGIHGYHERVGGGCRRLCESGRVQRRGTGGAGDPFTYFPAFKK